MCRALFRIFTLPALLVMAFAAAPPSATPLSSSIESVRSGTSRDHRITLEEGVEMVRRYRERHPDAILAGMFDREILDQILAQPGCAGVRMYYAEHADGTPSLVLVGVDAEGNDLYEGQIADHARPCPTFCGPDYSPLAPSEAPSTEIAETLRTHRITLEEGVEMVRRYRERYPDAVRAGMFDRGIFDEILAQSECAGIRMYYAEHEDGAPTLVLVGVDAEGNDLYEGEIADHLRPCPHWCSSEHSPLAQ